MSGYSMDDYVDVAQRIQDFKEAFPNGSLRPADPTKPYAVETIGDKTFVVYAAAAYRTEDDKAPGIGVAWEPFPGKSNFTRDSELQNAETSAWGRAIIAVLASTSKKIASAQEVRNREADRAQPASAEATIGVPTANDLRRQIGFWREQHNCSVPEVAKAFDALWPGNAITAASGKVLAEFLGKLQSGEIKVGVPT